MATDSISSSISSSSSSSRPATLAQPVSVLDVSNALHSRFFLITGGIARDGCPLITFPDVDVDAQSISNDGYRKIMTFIASIPTLSDTDIGYVVIIDKRKDKWNSVKTLLLKISTLFPGYVREVLVLRPDSFFQRTFKEVSSKWLHDNFHFEVVLLHSVEELQKKVDPAHLTSDLGGTFAFDVKEWVQHRFAIESYGKHCASLADRLLLLSTSLDEAEMPNDVLATEQLIAEHSRLKEEIVDDIMDARNQGDVLLSCFRRRSRSAAAAAEPSPLPHSPAAAAGETTLSLLGHDRLAHIVSTERLVAQLGEANARFNQFWECHQKRLDSCLRLRKFEESFKEMQFRLEQTVRAATELPRCGSSPAELEVLLADLRTFEADAEGHVARAEHLSADGVDLAEQSGGGGARAGGAGEDIAHSVLPKCAELERVCSLYRSCVAERRESLSRSADLHRNIEQLKKWCSNGLDLLADGLEVRLGSMDALQAGLLQVDAFLRSGGALNFSDPAEFRRMYDDVMCPATKERVQDTLLRAGDVQELCMRRRAALRDALAAATAAAAAAAASSASAPAAERGGSSPAQMKRKLAFSLSVNSADFKGRGDASPVASPARQPAKSASSSSAAAAAASFAAVTTAAAGDEPSLPSNCSSNPSLRMTLDGRGSSDCQGPTQQQLAGGGRYFGRKRSFSLKDGIKGIFLRKKRDGEDDKDAEPMPTLIADDEDEKCTSPEDKASHGSRKAAAAAMRSSVMSELVDTEKAYVGELREVVKGYVKAVNDASLSHLLPEQLLPGNAGGSVLFGNIEKVLAFHADLFLEELLACRQAPSDVSRCFLSRASDFRLYLDYCQNKPNSDKMLQEIGDSNPFFKECQQRLGHLLPLSSYLLKPVQRITKYQLLLREMLHYSEESETESEGSIADLRKALASMLDLLKHANDLMHQLAITGYKSAMPTGTDRGKLLMQGPLTVSMARRKDRITSFRLRSTSRHAFLYEKVLLFCKPKEELPGSHMIRTGSFRDHYRYKSSIVMTSVDSVAEDVREPRRLELRLRGGSSSGGSGVAAASCILQVPSASTRDDWLRELRRALLLLVDEGSSSASAAAAASQTPIGRRKLSSAELGLLPPSPSAEAARSCTAAVCSAVGARRKHSSSNCTGAETDEGWSSGEETHSDCDPLPPADEQKHSDSGAGSGKIQYPCLMTFTQASGDRHVSRTGDELLLGEGDVVECLSSAMAPLQDGSSSREMLVCTRIPGTEVKAWLPQACLLPYAGPKPITQEESGCSISSGSSSCQD